MGTEHGSRPGNGPGSPTPRPCDRPVRDRLACSAATCSCSTVVTTDRSARGKSLTSSSRPGKTPFVSHDRDFDTAETLDYPKLTAISRVIFDTVRPPGGRDADQVPAWKVLAANRGTILTRRRPLRDVLPHLARSSRKTLSRSARPRARIMTNTQGDTGRDRRPRHDHARRAHRGGPGRSPDPHLALLNERVTCTKGPGWGRDVGSGRGPCRLWTEDGARPQDADGEVGVSILNRRGHRDVAGGDHEDAVRKAVERHIGREREPGRHGIGNTAGSSFSPLLLVSRFFNSSSLAER